MSMPLHDMIGFVAGFGIADGRPDWSPIIAQARARRVRPGDRQD
jgi:hypothetical protein